MDLAFVVVVAVELVAKQHQLAFAVAFAVVVVAFAVVALVVFAFEAFVAFVVVEVVAAAAVEVVVAAAAFAVVVVEREYSVVAVALVFPAPTSLPTTKVVPEE